MPIHSIQWKAFSSSLDDEELIADAMAWLCNDKDSVVIEKTTSFHGPDIHIISVDISKRGLARKALAHLGEVALQQLLDESHERIDEENCIHFRLSISDLVCGRIVFTSAGEYRTIKGKVKLQIYPNDVVEEVAQRLLEEAIERAQRMDWPTTP